MNQEPNPIPTGYRKNAQGHLVPEDQIKDIDLSRDQIVTELFAEAKTLAGQVARFKSKALDEIQAFVELSAERYGSQLGGRKGNVTLTSFDGTIQILRCMATTMSFDERILAAKDLIDQCFTEWSEGAKPQLKTVIDAAFSPDARGNLATHKILALRQIKIDDAKWLKAMEAVADALQATGSKIYVRFYQRNKDGKYVQITLDPTEL